MVRHHQPRKGSVAFSPRKRAAKETPRVKSWPQMDEPKLLGLAGYKVGMTHALMTDTDKNSVVMGIRAYEKTSRGLKVITEVLADNLDQELSRKISLPKEYNKSEAIAKIQGALENTEEIRVLVHTNPKVTSVPKKKPDIFECGIGGANPEEKLNTALELLGNEVKASEIFNEGEFVDAIATTKGKGFQGVVKRWGIRIQYGKAVRAGKGRHVGSIGPWTPARTMWTVAQAGQMGYHKRTEFNKRILKIASADEVDQINPDGGFVKYGVVKNDYVLVKGSLPGPSKRLVILRQPIRPNNKAEDIPQINYISTKSKQGV